MKAKKIISMLLVGVMTLGLLAGCGAQTEETEPQQDTQTETEASGNEAGEESENTASVDDGGNTLVVYYSATGNTEAVANAISETTGGDLFELEPAEPYSDEDLDWTDNDSRFHFLQCSGAEDFWMQPVCCNFPPAGQCSVLPHKLFFRSSRSR